MDVNYASEELLKCLGEGIYPVHSRFEAGFNLQVAGTLSFVGNKHGEQLPYGLLLSVEDTEQLPDLRPGETVFTWNPVELCLETDGCSLNLKNAVPYHSRCRTHCLLGQEALNYFDQAAPLDVLTGLGGSIRALSDPTSEIAPLCYAFTSQVPEEIRENLKHWVGRGPGLTPSGDDLLTAVLLVDKINPFLSSTFVEVLRGLLEEGYTTDVSVAYYRAAFQGLFCSSLLEVGQALKTGDEVALKKSLERVLCFGHTSGQDMIAGLRLALAYLAKQSGKRETGGRV